MFIQASALGSYAVIVKNRFNDGQEIVSSSLPLQLVKPSVSFTTSTGGGDSIVVKYTSPAQPVITDVALKVVDNIKQIVVEGKDFISSSRDSVNGEELETKKEGENLIAIVPESIAGSSKGKLVDIRVVVPASKISFEVFNLDSSAPIVYAIDRNGVESKLATQNNGSVVDADISSLRSGKYTFFVETGTGRDKIRSPGQEIEIK